jgi:FAD/FMN-containing dehydrogenase
MIDLGGMRSVRVDPIRRTARAEGGTTWGDFDRETQAFRLATTGGSVSDTGIAGLTLGGGLGWLAGKYGLSCDNLLSIDLVTADARSCWRVPPRTPTSSGACAAGAAISAWRPLSNISSIKSARSSRGWCCTRSKAKPDLYRDFAMNIPTR